MSQQQGAELGAAFLRRFVEGGESPFVGGIHARVVLNQQGGYVHMLDGGEKRQDEQT